jgi:hypothetical protein
MAAIIYCLVGAVIVLPLIIWSIYSSITEKEVVLGDEDL